ncbi:hypothetical protein CCZ01_09235 [Helicobacter monodelphidis]|uniref:hypothetical protein n=1 Tax=Helicobacter sp. 15-1451 TaxID=2004995 RepID=UPI000DCDCE70|nr:hypothetical protein [Helicobacter sp. 15-1451]RAX56547.1 hypothetical protein CCZ01_09235 [Helicobacter sp. 15-1451]
MVMLEPNQIVEAKELLSRLNNLYIERADMEVFKKIRENSLKYEIASECEIFDKENNPLPNKIKIALVLACIDELFKDKENKKNAELSLMKDYKKALLKEELKEFVDAYMYVLEELETNALDIKESAKECSIIPKEVLQAVSSIAKENFKVIKEKKMVEAGFEIKQEKDCTEAIALQEQLKKLLS